MAARKSTTRSEATKALLAAGQKAATAAVTRAEELLALIERRKARIAEDFYDIGTALAELKKKKLHLALGYDSFAALMNKRSVMSVRTAEKLIEVVGQVPRKRALELGQEKAYALARLVATTPELDTIDSVLTKGAKIGKGRKSLAKASTRDIMAATKKVRDLSKKRDPAEADAKRAARSLQAAVRAAGGKGAVASIGREGGNYEVVLKLDATRVDEVVRALK